MELFWYIVGVSICAALLAFGLIMGWFWLVTIGFFVLPAVAVWGMVSSGPGSRHNPYHH
jgi:hypothetical protein